ncbi:MAG TPA: PqqD family protein [Conexibacter sp.]|nr:PqqD family protein [Conexibacter sp.]
MESGSPGSPAPQDEGLALDEQRLMWREVEDEVIVLDKRTWTYMGINGSGAVLWKEIAGGASVAQLVECLRATYGIDEAAAARDAGAFVEMLREHGLLAAPAE